MSSSNPRFRGLEDGGPGPSGESPTVVNDEPRPWRSSRAEGVSGGLAGRFVWILPPPPEGLRAALSQRASSATSGSPVASGRLSTASLRSRRPRGSRATLYLIKARLAETRGRLPWSLSLGGSTGGRGSARGSGAAEDRVAAPRRWACDPRPRPPETTLRPLVEAGGDVCLPGDVTGDVAGGCGRGMWRRARQHSGGGVRERERVTSAVFRSFLMPLRHLRRWRSGIRKLLKPALVTERKRASERDGEREGGLRFLGHAARAPGDAQETRGAERSRQTHKDRRGPFKETLCLAGGETALRTRVLRPFIAAAFATAGPAEFVSLKSLANHVVTDSIDSMYPEPLVCADTLITSAA